MVVFSDVHGRIDLLERLPGSCFACAGDVGDHEACLRWLRERRVPCVRGNHDRQDWPLEREVAGAWLAHCLVRAGEFLEVCSEAAARELALRTDLPLVFMGHTHLPGWWEVEGGRWSWTPVYGEASLRLDPRRRYLVNVGSLGEPHPPQKPCYVAWREGVVEFRRLG